MDRNLDGVRLAVIGGDERQIILVNRLLQLGSSINIVGMPEKEELLGCNFCKNLVDALENVDAIILPMPGTDNEGNIICALSDIKLKLTKEIFQKIPTNVPIFLGVAKPFLREWARFYQKKIIEIAGLDEIAIPNSIPTAEAAVQYAMQETPITIHGSNCIVIGFGRCGKTLARMLHVLGAKTTVFARKISDLARIKEMNMIPANYCDMCEILPQADIIFNTVPIQVLDKEKLSYVKKDVYIFDIASAPGGTDFQFAEQLGIKAVLAPSLPGKTAPKTAGLILAENLPNLIMKEISLPKKPVGGEA